MWSSKKYVLFHCVQGCSLFVFHRSLCNGLWAICCFQGIVKFMLVASDCKTLNLAWKPPPPLIFHLRVLRCTADLALERAWRLSDVELFCTICCALRLFAKSGSFHHRFHWTSLCQVFSPHHPAPQNSSLPFYSYWQLVLHVYMPVQLQ